MENQGESNEDFGRRMKRLMQEAQERYERMSPEDQRLLDEASRWHHEKAQSEIMASYPPGFEDNEEPTDNDSSVEELDSKD